MGCEVTREGRRVRKKEEYVGEYGKCGGRETG